MELLYRTQAYVVCVGFFDKQSQLAASTYHFGFFYYVRWGFLQGLEV